MLVTLRFSVMVAFAAVSLSFASKKLVETEDPLMLVVLIKLVSSTELKLKSVIAITTF